MLKKLFKSLAVSLTVPMTLMGVFGCEQELPVIDVTKIEISVPSVTLVKGQSLQLNAVVVPSNATDNAIEWVSLDETVVSVDGDGLVTAVEKGNAIVMARSGAVVAECEVTVVPVPVSGISLDKDELDINLGETSQLVATVSPDVAEYSEITWRSSDEMVVKVDASGKVTSTGSGIAVVTASVNEFEASCTVYSLGEPQIGDFYYADGHWFTSPLEGEIPVGIIFYVGDPTEHDSTLKNDHPECTHGLVLSLFSEISSPMQLNVYEYQKLISDWAAEDEEASKMIDICQSNVGEYLNKIVGYNNTRIMELFNEDPENANWGLQILDVLEAVRRDYPLPENTSGWYIPSAKELSLFCNGEYEDNIGEMNEMEMNYNPKVEMASFLSQRIYEIPGAAMFSPVYYISSSESPVERDPWGSIFYKQWSIKMSNGCVFRQTKDTRTAVLRPVFAF